MVNVHFLSLNQCYSSYRLTNESISLRGASIVSLEMSLIPKHCREILIGDFLF